MNTQSLEILRNQLVIDEGLKLKPYRDTVGKLTIGVGRNLDDVGITKEEALILLDHDIERAMKDLDHHLPWWRKMNEVRQRVLVNMAFNLGITKLKGFANTLQAMMRQDYPAAARGMANSKWARQVGARADRLILMMRTGVDKTTKEAI